MQFVYSLLPVIALVIPQRLAQPRDLCFKFFLVFDIFHDLFAFEGDAFEDALVVRGFEGRPRRSLY